jgi:alpha-1,3-mannosyltransferase
LFDQHAAGRLTVIENGIDNDKFRGAAAQTQTRTMIYFGRFVEHKRLPELFPLLAALKREHPDWRLIIAGRDGELTAKQLMGMAENAGVAEAVFCVPEPSDRQLRSLIGEASFFVCLSRYEGFGMAAVEAMSAGLLPVLSDIPPFRRLCEDASIGVLVTPENSHEIARILEANVLDDAANRFRRAWLRDTVRRYDWEQVAQQYADTYYEVLGIEEAEPVALAAQGRL